eukprot:403345111
MTIALLLLSGLVGLSQSNTVADIVKIDVQKVQLPQNSNEYNVLSPTRHQNSFFKSANQATIRSFINSGVKKLGSTLFGSSSESNSQESSNSYDFLNNRPNLKQTAPSYTSGLLNYENFAYLGKLYIGSQKRELELIFDTGSAWLVVEGPSCATCVSTIFDNTKSTTYTQVSSTEQTLQYGSATVKGKVGKDTISLDINQNYKATNFQLFVATYQTGISSYFDGIAGMSREIVLDRFGNGPKFLKSLKDAGAISSTIQGWYLSNSNDTQSYVELGGYTTSIIRSGETLQEFDLTTSFYWLGSVQGFRVGSTEKLSDGTVMGYYTDSAEVIYDTGTTLLYAPDAVTSLVVGLLRTGFSYQLDSSGFTYIYCSQTSNMKSFFVYIGGRYLEITPQAYMIKVDEVNGQAMCVIGIAASGDSTWLVGDVFLKNFFSVWDDDRGKISFAPHKYTTATIVTGTKPTTYFQNSTSSSAEMDELLNYILQLLLSAILIYVGSKYGVDCVSTAIKNMKAKKAIKDQIHLQQSQSFANHMILQQTLLADNGTNQNIYQQLNNANYQRENFMKSQSGIQVIIIPE